MKNGAVPAFLGGILLLTACTAGPNSLANVAATNGTVAGFWLGLWHGFIMLFTFIISLFKDDITIYAVNNNGGWYNFGFLFGAMMFWSGSQGGSQKAYWKKKCETMERDKAVNVDANPKE